MTFDPTYEPPACPRCGYPISLGQTGKCSNCGHDLPVDLGQHDVPPQKSTADPDDVAPQKPTEERDHDRRLIAAEDAGVSDHWPPQVLPDRICPHCGQVNPPTQRRCERCSTSLDAPAPTPPTHFTPPPPTPRRRVPVTGIVIGALVLVLLLSYVTFRLTQPNTEVPEPSQSPRSDSTTPPPTLSRIDSSTVTVTASSTLPDSSGTYDAANTLDGDRKTAWNSDGDVVGEEAAGVTLTYQFSGSVQLQQLRIRNGYQKSDAKFYDNSRVSKLLVSADGAEHSFKLRDEKAEQRLTFDFGETTRVVLVIQGVYRDVPDATRYRDCAISEVAFFGR